MHRDLKPENILLDSLNNPKIGDFGSCALEPNKEKRYSYAGTLSFMPPEMAEMKGYDCSCDLWNLGLIMHEILTGSPSIKITNINQILTIEKLTPPDNWDFEAQDLYSKLVSKNNRISIEEVITHKWFL